MQLSHQEPAVLHATIAVGIAHRKQTEYGSLQIMNVIDQRQFLGLRQYVKAIGLLRTRIQDLDDPQSNRIALISCLLFICLEMLRGNRLAALTHLGTGSRILSSPSTLRSNGSNSDGNGKPLWWKSDGVLSGDFKLVDKHEKVYARFRNKAFSAKEVGSFEIVGDVGADERDLVVVTGLAVLAMVQSTLLAVVVLTGREKEK